MPIRVVHLNKSMNVIRSQRYDIVSLNALQEAMKKEILAFWNFKFHDPSVSFRVLSDEGFQCDLFDNTDNSIF